MRIPIPFLDSSTALWLLSRHECFVYFRFFHRACGFEQWVRATLAQLLDSASQDVRLSIRGIAVTVLVCFCGGESIPFLDSSTELWLLLRHTCSSTSYVSYYEPALFAHFGFVGGHMVWHPHLSCLPSRFPHVRSLYWVFRLLWRSSELQLRWRRSPRRLQSRFFC